MIRVEKKNKNGLDLIQLQFQFPDELIVDNFAGGGGASLGIEMAFGRPVDIAINHDPEAVAMHTANHPHTRHFCESVWDIDPRKVTRGQPVGLAWFSPDCKHFSKAKGGKPVNKNIRGLAWVAVRWAATVKPRVIVLENVEEFQTWGPLTAEDKPCPKRKGLTFRRWVRELEKHGYHVEWRQLRACDFGAPTIRKRLFLIARCDGLPIAWPAPTHGEGLQPYRTAAECIDWSHSCPSIFTRKRPLAEATLRRIARGVQRFVLEAGEPFIVTCNHGGEGFRGQGMDHPFKTVTAARDAHGVVAPYFIPRHGERAGQDPRTRSVSVPMPTITATANGASLVSAFMAKHFGGNESPGWPLIRPISTVTARDHHAIVTSHLLKLRNNCDGQDNREPLHTVATGGHFGEVRAFLVKYYGTAVGQDIRDPMHTVTAKHRMGLVTLEGEDYQLVDIGMRMLEPRELYRAQGFPDSYKIDPSVNGRRLSKAAQVRMCGNSVCPPVACAVVSANVGIEQEKETAAA